jgi:hypothetical protein
MTRLDASGHDRTDYVPFSNVLASALKGRTEPVGGEKQGSLREAQYRHRMAALILIQGKPIALDIRGKKQKVTMIAHQKRTYRGSHAAAALDITPYGFYSDFFTGALALSVSAAAGGVAFFTGLSAFF